MSAQRAQQLEAIHTRHHDVGENQVGRVSESSSHRLLTVLDGGDLVFAAEETLDVFPHVAVVVGEQDAGTVG